MLKSMFRKMPDANSPEYYRMIFKYFDDHRLEDRNTIIAGIEEIIRTNYPEQMNNFWRNLTETFLTKRDLSKDLGVIDDYADYFVYFYELCFARSRQDMDFFLLSEDFAEAYRNNLEKRVKDILEFANTYQKAKATSTKPFFFLQTTNPSEEISWKKQLLQRFIGNLEGRGINRGPSDKHPFMKGHKEVIDVLYKVAFEFPDMQKVFLSHNNYKLILGAVSNGHLHLLEWWWEKAKAFEGMQKSLALHNNNQIIHIMIMKGYFATLQCFLNDLDKTTKHLILYSGVLTTAARYQQYEILMWLWKELRDMKGDDRAIIHVVFEPLIKNDVAMGALTEIPEKLVEIDPLLRQEPILTLAIAKRLKAKGAKEHAIKYFAMAAEVSGNENVYSKMYKQVRTLTFDAISIDTVNYKLCLLASLLGMKKSVVEEMATEKGLDDLWDMLGPAFKHSLDVSSKSYSHIPDTVVGLHKKPKGIDGEPRNRFQVLSAELASRIGLLGGNNPISSISSDDISLATPESTISEEEGASTDRYPSVAGG